jgi:hypothetical protein
MPRIDLSHFGALIRAARYVAERIFVICNSKKWSREMPPRGAINSACGVNSAHVKLGDMHEDPRVACSVCRANSVCLLGMVVRNALLGMRCSAHCKFDI